MSLNETKVRELLRKIVCGYDLLREEKRIEFSFDQRDFDDLWDITIEMPFDPELGHDSSNNKYLSAIIRHFESAGYGVGKVTEKNIPAKKIWGI